MYLPRTLFGDTAPYEVHHGGAQGDSQEVVFFELMGICQMLLTDVGLVVVLLAN